MPVISPTAVKVALDGLRFASGRSQSSPLADLYLVDLVLEDMAFPLVQNRRHYALQVVLTDLITGRFERLLTIFELPLPAADCAYTAAAQHIGQCCQVGTPELMGWCWLYYAYVRTDLDMNRTRFARLCHLDPRTLYRYQTAILRRFVHCLVEAEWQARIQARRAGVISGNG
jgi:hypothetical protein